MSCDSSTFSGLWVVCQLSKLDVEAVQVVVPVRLATTRAMSSCGVLPSASA